MLTELTAQAHTIDAGRPVVFYCRRGARSAMATKAFCGSGFDDAKARAEHIKHNRTRRR